ncbi:MAG: hypothetical protein DWQ51_20350 [Microcystis wesenbergii TW10]|uniref:Uncharacterized protein n=1 Tax=Microcystis wesenbergii TW10 TaxID=2060474 RepID=A0A3E0LJF0_9CHRO|nr:MAG: hypothetical protein DWQ51_20350 [Microcystis wesenbergii TW10]
MGRWENKAAFCRSAELTAEAFCLLPFAFCLLPFASCLLPPAFVITIVVIPANPNPDAQSPVDRR